MPVGRVPLIKGLSVINCSAALGQVLAASCKARTSRARVSGWSRSAQTWIKVSPPGRSNRRVPSYDCDAQVMTPKSSQTGIWHQNRRPTLYRCGMPLRPAQSSCLISLYSAFRPPYSVSPPGPCNSDQRGLRTGKRNFSQTAKNFSGKAQTKTPESSPSCSLPSQKSRSGRSKRAMNWLNAWKTAQASI